MVSNTARRVHASDQDILQSWRIAWKPAPPGVLVIAVVLCALYFLPTWIAGGRNHHNQYAIFASNLLLGWTFLGWVG